MWQGFREMRQLRCKSQREKKISSGLRKWTEPCWVWYGRTRRQCEVQHVLLWKGRAERKGKCCLLLNNSVIRAAVCNESLLHTRSLVYIISYPYSTQYEINLITLTLIRQIKQEISQHHTVHSQDLNHGLSNTLIRLLPLTLLLLMHVTHCSSLRLLCT